MEFKAVVLELRSLLLSQASAIDAVEAHVAWRCLGVALPSDRRLITRRCLHQEQSLVRLNSSFRSGRVMSAESTCSLNVRLVLHVANTRRTITLIALEDLAWGIHDVCMRCDDAFLDLGAVLRVLISHDDKDPQTSLPSPRLIHWGSSGASRRCHPQQEQVPLTNYVVEACRNSSRKTVRSDISEKVRAELIANSGHLGNASILVLLIVSLGDRSTIPDESKLSEIARCIENQQVIEAYIIAWLLNHFPVRSSYWNHLPQLLCLLLSKCEEHDLCMFVSAIVSSLIDLLSSLPELERKAAATDRWFDRGPDAAVRSELIRKCLAVFIQSIQYSMRLVQSCYFAAVFELEVSHSQGENRRNVCSSLYRSLIENMCSPELVNISHFMKDLLRCLQCSQADFSSTSQKSVSFRGQLKSRLSKYFHSQRETSLTSPFDASYTLIGVNLENCKVFPSSRAPALVEFKSLSSGEVEIGCVRLILKRGDDLRVDSMVMKLQSALHRILFRVGLDLQPKLYGVAPTSLNEGILECIDGMALSAVQKDHNGSILEYLSKVNNDAKESQDVPKAVLQRYVRSVAFSSVFCFVFGVQDRHLDNILLSKDGALVHIDFAYMFGADPKAASSLVRLTRSMVDAMGGEFSSQYEEFQQLCCLAYNSLRHYRHELHLLVSSFVNSGLPYVALKENRKALAFVDERLLIDSSGE